MVIGITGGTACGQTTVSKILEGKGLFLIYADEVARELVDTNKDILIKLIQAFGSKILDEHKRLKRKELGKIVFSDREKLAKLNAIVHPYLIAELKNRIEKAKKNHKYIAVDAALLVENGIVNWFDILIVVYAKDEIRIQRLLKRDNLTPQAARQRISAQLPIEKKMDLADYVIYNNGTLSETIQQVNEIWQQILEKE